MTGYVAQGQSSLEAGHKSFRTSYLRRLFSESELSTNVTHDILQRQNWQHTTRKWLPHLTSLQSWWSGEQSAVLTCGKFGLRDNQKYTFVATSTCTCCMYVCGEHSPQINWCCYSFKYFNPVKLLKYSFFNWFELNYDCFLYLNTHWLLWAIIITLKALT